MEGDIYTQEREAEKRRLSADIPQSKTPVAVSYFKLLETPYISQLRSDYSNIPIAFFCNYFYIRQYFWWNKMSLKGVKILKKISLVTYSNKIFTTLISLHLHKPKVFRSNPLESGVDLRPLSHEDGFTQRSEKKKEKIYWLAIWDHFLIIAWKRKKNGLHAMCLYLNFANYVVAGRFWVTK